ncbi:putative CRAL-TRIO lipid binding domain-containing protein [Lupinus albus]|uniref:Putative CRAL-TRIO lipid binding domain-containing protein n=1 Tax=Lupinus albus TaxID=3870 RepID=A0A6A4PRX9_LUPAL|nr:putative CRAL-TRIO lipid binding domain-containing protein [Lupinus albus]
MPPGQEQFLAIADIKGWGYANSDIQGYLNALTILQDYHPERLGKLFIVHAPYMFMKVWKVIYPFVDNNTRKNVTHKFVTISTVSNEAPIPIRISYTSMHIFLKIHHTIRLGYTYKIST